MFYLYKFGNNDNEIEKKPQILYVKFGHTLTQE